MYSVKSHLFPRLISGNTSVYLDVFLENFEVYSTDSSRVTCDLPEGLIFNWLFLALNLFVFTQMPLFGFGQHPLSLISHSFPYN